MATNNSWNNDIEASVSGITLNSGTNAISISTDASATTVNIATGGAVKTTTLGSTNSTSATSIKGGTGASSFQPTTTGTLALGTTSTGNVSLGNSTGTTSIQFGTGSALTTFVDWTAFTPTIVGASTAGTTTYGTQQGYYMRIGNLAIVQFFISITAATGTGGALIGGLPFTVNNSTNYTAYGTIRVDGGAQTYPAGTTYLTVSANPGNTTASIVGSGSVTAGAVYQMQNTTITFIGTLNYRV